MTSKLSQLAERREHLVTQAAAQRDALAQNMAPWRAPLALADQGVATCRTLVRHPALLLGATFMLAVLYRRRAAKWPGFLWVGWQIGHRILKDRKI